MDESPIIVAIGVYRPNSSYILTGVSQEFTLPKLGYMPHFQSKKRFRSKAHRPVNTDADEKSTG